MKEEEHRNQEETAAYYAWKRGEAPLGSAPTYIPPDPAPPPPETEIVHPTPLERIVRATVPSDDVQSFIRQQLSSDQPVPEEKPRDLTKKVDIDSVDADDLSVEGRRLKMDAMADELASFSEGQRKEAERHEAGEAEGRKEMYL